jgi:hypothetical protein
LADRPPRIVVVPWLWPGIAAITLGTVVFIRRGCEHDPVLLAHEAEHVRQWQEMGRWRFLREYLGAYWQGRRCGLGHAAAYRAIPLEREARIASGEDSPLA